MKVKLPILVLGLAMVLSGCAVKSINPKQHLNSMHSSFISQGKPPAYVDGYVDGCSSGRRLAGDNNFTYRKNNARAEQDALYAKGWQDGQINCGNEYLVERQNANTALVGAPEISSVEKQRYKAEEAEMRAIWDELKK
jgi:hypothetical protein